MKIDFVKKSKPLWVWEPCFAWIPTKTQTRNGAYSIVWLQSLERMHTGYGFYEYRLVGSNE